MMMTPAPAPVVVAKGNITFEDVQIALGSTDPDATHAGKLRAILGRGSNKTVQIHLDAIRRARAPTLPGTQAPPPSLPKDVMESIWSSAWSAAQAMTYGRTEKLSAERDAALQISTTSSAEIEALNEDVDAMREKIVLAEEHAAVLTAEAQTALESLARVNEGKLSAQAQTLSLAELANADAAKVIEQLKTEKARVEADSVHAAELAVRDARIAENVMQSTIDKLNDQIVELKGLLRTAMTPISTATKNS